MIVWNLSVVQNYVFFLKYIIFIYNEVDDKGI